MLQTAPLPLPDSETGLHIVRWKAEGFFRMQRSEVLDRRSEFELIEGLVLHREVGSKRHDAVVDRVCRRLSAARLEVDPEHELVSHEQSCVVYPDMVVTDRTNRPCLVVEVSDGAERLDHVEKPRLYSRMGIEVYWQIDLVWRVMYVHLHPGPNGYGMRASAAGDRSLPSGMPELSDVCFDDFVEAGGLDRKAA